MSRTQSVTYSIFGQIEAVVAKAMADEGKGRIIEQKYLAGSTLYDDNGRIAQFAITFNHAYLQEFEDRIANLYA